uniref:Uncharacterized protein n=1 Tax=Hyaloperonospora arabidopsidis (strain Emoy2) TaxID=559515 RepID=M4BE20_HYAAE
MHDTPMYPREKLLETLLLIAQSQCSIYDKTRISGEYRTAHCMLPTDVRVEQLDRCSDTMDACYVNAMANYFVTTRASRSDADGGPLEMNRLTVKRKATG